MRGKKNQNAKEKHWSQLWQSEESPKQKKPTNQKLHNRQRCKSQLKNLITQGFLHKARSQELQSKQNKESAQTSSRAINNSHISYWMVLDYRQPAEKWENEDTCSGRETEERLECLKHRMMLLNFPRKNCVIKNQACRTETREAECFWRVQDEPQKSY